MKEQKNTEEQAKAYYSLVIENTADEVWDAIRDFQDTGWMGEGFQYETAADEVGNAAGATRSFSSDEGQISEHLVVHSDDDRFYTYNYEEGSPDGVNDFQASIRVAPTEESNNAYVEWTATFTCLDLERANLEKYYVDNMAKALTALNEYLLKVKK